MAATLQDSCSNLAVLHGLQRNVELTLLPRCRASLHGADIDLLLHCINVALQYCMATILHFYCNESVLYGHVSWPRNCRQHHAREKDMCEMVWARDVLRIYLNTALLSHSDKIFETRYRSCPGFWVIMSNSSTRIYPDTRVLESILNKYPDIRIYILWVSEYSDIRKFEK